MASPLERRALAWALVWLLGCSSAPAPGPAGGGGQGGQGGQHGQGGASALEELLAALRSDRDAALLSQSRAAGWPAPVEDGWLVVSADPELDRVAGDHDGWHGTLMQEEADFHWAVVVLSAGDRYKLTDGTRFEADPWSRSYGFDEHGEMSQLAGASAHLERHFEVSRGELAPRTVRLWIPEGPASHVLYAHDGQNLFDPAAPWGGWRLQESLPPAMLVVAVDNTPARMDEYTHVPDDLGSGAVGGDADAYAALVNDTVRGLVREHYGEPPIAGVMGSSLGGLVSFHLAHRYPQDYAFAASLSGTMGWGSIGASTHNETMIERYAAAGHRATALYLDSGGGGACLDGDGDGIEDDDPGASDNYCENQQLSEVLAAAGYTYEVDLWHWHEPGAAHDEAAWAARVWRPLEIFAAL